MADLNAVDDVASLKKRVRELEEETQEKHARIAELEDEVKEGRQNAQTLKMLSAFINGRQGTSPPLLADTLLMQDSEEEQQDAPQTADTPAPEVAHPLGKGAQPSMLATKLMTLSQHLDGTHNTSTLASKQMITKVVEMITQLCLKLCTTAMSNSREHEKGILALRAKMFERICNEYEAP